MDDLRFTSLSSLAIRARWVLPVDKPPIENGAVLIARGRIVAVGSYQRLKAEIARETVIVDFGDAAILPALVNAHTHLELSDCPRPLKVEGRSFTDWIEAVIAHRRNRGGYTPRALQMGLAECFHWGISAVGDIAQPGCVVDDYFLWPGKDEQNDRGLDLPERSFSGQVSAGEERPARTATPSHDLVSKWPRPKGVAFLECLSPRPELAEAIEKQVSSFLASPWPPLFRPGLAPHAPYTVHVDILRRLIELARERKLPVAFHLAESQEELELLETKGGAIRRLLESRGLWSDGLTGGLRVGDYLGLLAEAPRVLIIHGNFLTPDEFAFLGRHPQLWLVHCPRTFAHFGWGRFPLGDLLRQGVKVILGTDSRASTADLNLLAELTHVCRMYPEIPPERLVRLVTVEPAQALGLDQELGSLSPGKLADLVVYPLSPGQEHNPYSFLTLSEAKPLGVFIDGHPL